MSDEIRCTLDQLPRLIERRIQKIQKGLAKALDKTAEDAVEDIQNRAPKAFGDLRESVHKVDGPKVIVDAPHAGAVEIGSPPHVPNMEALLAWVKLRGMQGLTRRGNLRSRFSRDMGPTTPKQATAVASLLKDLEVRGNHSTGRHSPIDAPTQVALAIAKQIEKEGTKPHFYMRDSLPIVAMQLAKHVRRSLGK